MDIGKCIKEYRAKNNLTQADFGHIIGVNKQTVSKWEKGVSRPSSKKLYEIIHVIDIPAQSIFEDSEKVCIFEHRRKYNIGLNSLYENTYDFRSFGLFIDAFRYAHLLLEPNSHIMGFLIHNASFEDNDTDDATLPISSIQYNGDEILIKVFEHSLYIIADAVSDIKTVTDFNNEAFAFNIYNSNTSNGFLQIILSFNNGM